METEANPQEGAGTIDNAMDRIGALYDEPSEPQEAESPEETESSDEPVKEADSEENIEEEADSETQEAQEEESEAESFNTLEELADATGMSLEDFMANIKGRVKINGVEEELPLAELQKGYQMEADYRRKTSELSEQRKAFDAERQQVAQELTARYQEAEKVSEFMEQQLMGEYNSIDWNQLRQENPAEWSALQQDYNNRYNQIQNIKAGVADQLQEQVKEQQRKQLEEQSAFLEKEKQALAQIIPEFGNEDAAAEMRGKMRSFLNAQGFSDEEIGMIVDHRHVLLIRDAMAYRGLKSKEVEVKNKVKKAPKLQKPGQKSATTEQVVNKKLRAKLKKSGRLEDAVDLIDF